MNRGLSSESAILLTKFQLWELVLFEVMLSYYLFLNHTSLALNNQLRQGKVVDEWYSDG